MPHSPDVFVAVPLFFHIPPRLHHQRGAPSVVAAAVSLRQDLAWDAWAHVQARVAVTDDAAAKRMDRRPLHSLHRLTADQEEAESSVTGVTAGAHVMKFVRSICTGASSLLFVE